MECRALHDMKKGECGWFEMWVTPADIYKRGNKMTDLIDQYIALKVVETGLKESLEENLKERKVLEAKITELFDNEGIRQADSSTKGKWVGLTRKVYHRIEDKIAFKKFLIDKGMADEYIEEKFVTTKCNALAKELTNRAEADSRSPIFPPGFGSSVVLSLRVYQDSATKEFKKAGDTLIEKIRKGEWE